MNSPHYNFIPTVYTSTLGVILMWKDFENFYILINFIDPLSKNIYTYFILSFLNLCLGKMKAYHLLGQGMSPQFLGS